MEAPEQKHQKYVIDVPVSFLLTKNVYIVLVFPMLT